jgi:predicted transcriptional regulator
MKKPRSSQNILDAAGTRQERPPLPTGTELEILHLLWENGPSTVRQVLRALRDRREQEVGYTTALKMLQVMTEKRLVGRDETTRPQVYSARLPREQTQRQLVTDLLDRGFGGSAKHLIMQALATRKASDEELAQIEELLDGFEGDRK